jgi:hypothetical protein
MAFFNSKEDVYEIQLTSFGKHLLSEGKFLPIYYSFVDNEVAYDSSYDFMSESQNNVQVRLKETPRSQCQSIFAGVEDSIKKMNKMIKTGQVDPKDVDSIQHTLEKVYSLPMSLGNSSLSSDKCPAWSISFLNGSMTGSINFLTGNFQMMRVPQLNTIVEYQTSVQYTNFDEEQNKIDTKPVNILEPKVYSDGSYIKVDEDYLLLAIEEKNVDFLKENFDIEVFLYNESAVSNVTGSSGNLELNLTPLSFLSDKKGSMFVMSDEDMFKEPNVTNVEYYFDIFVDEEIGDEYLCKAYPTNKIIMTDKSFMCSGQKIVKSKDIYKIENDDTEECI